MIEPTTPEDVSKEIPLREGFRWDVDGKDLDLWSDDDIAGWARADEWTCDSADGYLLTGSPTRLRAVTYMPGPSLYANALALAKHCGALA